MGKSHILTAAVFLFYILGSAAGVKAATGPMQPEDEQSGNGSLSPVAYAVKALEAVQENIVSGEATAEEFRFELAAPPIVKPDCSEYHASGSRPGQNTEAAANMPEAFVHIDVFQRNVYKERATVIFMSQEPEVRFSGRQSSISIYSVDVMDQDEMQQVAAGLDPFFKTAADVSRSSERFYAFFPLDIRSLLKHPGRNYRLNMPPGAVDPSWRLMLLKETGSRETESSALDDLDSWKKKLSDKDLRLFVALTLDLAVQKNWLALEGLEIVSDTHPQPQLLVSKPQDYIKNLEKTVRQNRQLLEKSGTLSPRHFRMTCDYIQQLMGQGFIVKEVSKPEPCPCFLLPFSGEGFVSDNKSRSEIMTNLPAEANLYLFGISGLRLHFSDIETYPRLVCVAQN